MFFGSFLCGLFLFPKSWLTPLNRNCFMFWTCLFSFILSLGSSQFPFNFCGHRWLENVPVAQRALSIWENVQLYLRKATNPPTHTKSYAILMELTSDDFLEVKAECFLTLAGDVIPFLRKFQGSEPLMPYLACHLQRVLKTLLQRWF